MSFLSACTPVLCAMLALHAALQAEVVHETKDVAAIKEYLEALRLSRDGRYSEAFEALRRSNSHGPSSPRVYPKMIWVSQKAGDLSKAEAYFFSLLSHPSTAAFGHYALALLHAHRGDLEAGQAELMKSIAGAPTFAPAYTQFVLLSLRRGQAQAARSFLERQISSDPDNGVLQYAIAYLFQQQRDYARVFEHLRAAKAIVPNLWELLDLEFKFHIANAHFEQALGTLASMLDRAESAGQLESKVHILCNIGAIRSDMGNYPEAIRRLREAAVIARELGDKSLEQASLGQLSLVFLKMGKYREALEQSKAALALAQQTGDRAAEGRNLGVSARIQAAMGHHSEAIRAFLDAIELARQAGDRAGEADQLAGLALVYRSVGFDSKVLGNLEAAVAAARSAGNPWLEGRFLEALGRVHLQSGKHREALQACEQGLALARRAGDRSGEAASLASSADVQTHLGAIPEALRRYDEALRIAVEIGAAPLQGDIHNSLGALHLRQGKTAQAREHYQKAQAIGTEARLPEVTWKAQAGLGAVSERQGLMAEARAAYHKAVEEIETVRANTGIAEEKAGYLEGKLDIYRRLVALLVRMHEKQPAGGFDAEAFRFAERARARSSLDLLGEAAVRGATSIDPALAERQRAVERQFSRLQSELIGQYSAAKRDQSKIRELLAAIEKADEEHRAVRRQIREKSPGFANLRTPEPITLRELQQGLDPKTILLQYVTGPDTSFLFAVTRDQHRIARLPGTAALAARVNRLREAISIQPARTALPSYWMEAQALHRDLIAPAAGLLAGRDELIIVPDGVLHYLPFNTLLAPVRGAPSDLDPARLPYLIRNHAVSYAPSATVLATVRRTGRQRPGPEKTLIAFADATYGKPQGSGADNLRSLTADSVRGAQRLLGSRREVENIARLYPAGSTSLFLAGDANERNVKQHGLGQYAVVHFAAHGILDEQNPQFSGLLLSRPQAEAEAAGDEDGLLQVYEILNLNLNADLVVLSACQTALGKAVKGEGLVGLTQAFLHAGAGSVMASLWKVEDRSTADLMIRFHRHLTAGRSSSQALRQAQLDLIGGTSFAHPYYWAAHSLAGDSRPLRPSRTFSGAPSRQSNTQ